MLNDIETAMVLTLRYHIPSTIGYDYIPYNIQATIYYIEYTDFDDSEIASPVLPSQIP